MKKNEFHVTVTFEGEEYPFDNGSEAYIFHTGILNDLHKIYGTQVLPIYTAIVLDCYRTDGGHTPLGALADYVATHWGLRPRLVLTVFAVANTNYWRRERAREIT